MVRFRQHNVFIDPDDRSRSAICRALEREHYVTAVHSPFFGFTFASTAQLAHSAIEVETKSTAALTRALRTLDSFRRIDAVFVFRDAVIEQTAAACASNGIPFTPLTAVRLARNKILTRKALDRQRVRNVRFAHARWLGEIPTAVRRIGFPCALKPVKGHGSVLAFRLRDHDDLLSSMHAIRDWRRAADPDDTWVLRDGFICEEWLDGPVISVELAWSGSAHIPVAVALGTMQEFRPCAGYGNILPLPSSKMTETCTQYGAAACHALGLRFGMCDVEMVFTPEGPVLLEVNPRRMGGEMQDAFELATNRSLSDVMLNAYAGKRIPSLPRTFGKIAVIRKVIPGRDGKVANRKKEWLRDFTRRNAEVHIRNYALEPNAKVQRLQVVARILVIARTREEGLSIADEALARLENESGLAFVKGYTPAIAAPLTTGAIMTTPPPTPAQIAAFKQRKKASPKSVPKATSTGKKRKKK